MSLINDALKKAKQTLDEQKPSGPASVPPLQPAEPSPQRGFWQELLLPLTLAVVLALAGIFFWRWFDQTRRTEAQTAAATTTPIVRAKTFPADSAATATPTNGSSVTSRSVKNESPSQLPAGETSTVVAAEINPSPVGGTNETTHETVVVAAEPPPLKLQGIFYSRKTPTAVINGKIRGVGERIGKARVLAIAPESVTVVVEGKTNELTLP